MDEKQAKSMFLEKIAESFGQFALEREEDKTRDRLTTMGALAGGGVGYALRKKPADYLSSLKTRSRVTMMTNPLERMVVRSLKPESYTALKKIAPALMIAGGLVGGNLGSKILYDFASD